MLNCPHCQEEMLPDMIEGNDQYQDIEIAICYNCGEMFKVEGDQLHQINPIFDIYSEEADQHNFQVQDFVDLIQELEKRTQQPDE